MTQLKQMDPPVEQPVRVLDPETLHDATVRYLANPLYRAARYEELVLDDNPYRRPVRPDDIDLVDFSAPLDRDNFSQLSALMGHRMLLNIFDTRKLLLPQAPTLDKWRDFSAFYADENRMLGDVLRPHLEAHLFSFVHTEARPRVTDDPAALVARLGDVAAARRDQAERLHDLVHRSPSRENLLGMVGVQSTATALNAELTPGRGASPAGAALEMTGPTTRRLHDLARHVADRTALKFEPHSHFQYYLPSTLALMNYVNAAAQDPGRAFRLVGALSALGLDVDAMALVYARLLGDESAPTALPAQAGGPAPAADVVAAAERLGGPFAVAEVSRGLEEYAVLLDVQHDDYVQQFTWIDDMPALRDKAGRLQRAIDEHRIPVALDTFVESWEECSTTHVHDDNRLLVIESGEMEFWNCVGVRHAYQPGDMTYIPRNRLHGSVVLTGECVYHQPVITSELEARFG